MKTQRRRVALFAIGAIAATCAAFPAFAYVGPGAGLTLLGALWGLILAVFMSVGFVILWPFRKLLRRHKRQATLRDREAVEPLADDSDNTMLANRPEDRDQR
jgi:uncharacterized membrane protein YccC